MYCIYADGVCFYNDTFLFDSMKVIDPKLTLEDSAAGSLSITIPPTNLAYGKIIRMVTDISVTKDGDEIWAGRVLSESKDFWNNRVLLCEGELAFLNDSTQPPAEYHNQTVRGFLETLVSIHNSKVASNRQFTVGTVTVTDSNDSLYRYTNYEKTIECINEKLIDRLGGHLRVRKEDGVRYLDYLEDYPNTNSQVIEFGKNLMDFTRQWDLTEFATVILPLGNRLEESSIEALDAYLTVESVNDGSMYVKSECAIAEYGWIEKVVNWDDVSTAAALLTKGKEYLEDIQFDDMDVELSALDLHYLNIDYEAVKLLDKIRVISKPHGMDRFFPVTKLEIPLDHPENTQFTLGDTVRTTLTSVNNKTNSELLNKIENLPKASAILSEAKANATAIMNMATNGYITITNGDNGTNELYISDTQDYTNATRLWKWGINGLGYSKDGGETYGLAMTMDGAIVADYITTGILRSLDGSFYLDLDNGILKITGSASTVDGKQIATSDDVAASKEAANAYTDDQLTNYSTIVQTEVSIQLASDSITSTVSKMYLTKTDAASTYTTESTVSSIIEQKADSIRLKASKIAWTSTYSSMTEDGVLTCTSAKLTGSLYCGNTSGYINITNGIIYAGDSNGASTIRATRRFADSGDAELGLETDWLVFTPREALYIYDGDAAWYAGYTEWFGPLHFINGIYTGHSGGYSGSFTLSTPSGTATLVFSNGILI